MIREYDMLEKVLKEVIGEMANMEQVQVGLMPGTVLFIGGEVAESLATQGKIPTNDDDQGFRKVFFDWMTYLNQNEKELENKIEEQLKLCKKILSIDVAHDIIFSILMDEAEKVLINRKSKWEQLKEEDAPEEIKLIIQAFEKAGKEGVEALLGGGIIDDMAELFLSSEAEKESNEN